MSDSDIFLDTPETDSTIAWVRQPVNNRKIRSNHQYKTMREQYRIECMVRRQADGSKGDPCCICSEPISYSLQYPHPLSWSLEHLISVKDRPDLLLDKNNYGSSHMLCNSLKGPDELIADTGEKSADWM